MEPHGPVENPPTFTTVGEAVATAANPRLSLFSRRRWYVRGFGVVFLVVLAWLLRVWLDREFGLTLHYLTYFPAVFAAALLFGTVEGLYATAASALVGTNALAPGALAHLSLPDKASVVILIASGVGLSIAAGALRTRTERLQHALEQLRSTRQEITDEQRRLHEATARLDSVVSSTDEAITSIDTGGILTQWNKGAEIIFGYTAEEMMGQRFRKLLLPGPEADAEAVDILSRLGRGETVEKFNVQRITKDGQTVHINLSVSPIRDEIGTIVGASAISRDITETIRLQKQLQQSQKMEAIGQLAGGIAHDFNNLLAIVAGALELQLPAIAGNEEAMHRWEVASRAARRGAELTRRLLAFSSMEHFKVAPTDLNHSIRSTMEMAQRLIGPEIKIHLNLQRSIGQVLVDPAGLESAILNLVINARDAMMPRGGALTVGTRTAELEESFTATLTGPIQAGLYACISVTDTGCGMSQQVLDRACEPFFTTKERGRGTGLGLSMVYGFVKHSGGGIRIYSEVGYGTTITFYLPFEIADRAVPIALRPLLETRPETRRTGRVLIVDDEAELLDISVSYLTARGYAAVSAHSGKEALDLLGKGSPVDVLVTDVVMGGGMDGMELAQAVHRLYPQVRIIYSSGFPADALSTRSLPLADSLVLQKPYRLSELGASIDHALGIRQLLATAPTPAAPSSEDAFTAAVTSSPFN